jgi:proteic killer suppression protein
MNMIGEFRHEWLKEFFEEGKRHRMIPDKLHSALVRKLDVIAAAESSVDLVSPPSNRFEYLHGRLASYCSIRVNRQYRLIFIWEEEFGRAMDLRLNPHTYR